MITNFFSRAALAKVASLHSLQKPSALSIGAARAALASDERKEQRENADHGVSPGARGAEYCQIVILAETHGPRELFRPAGLQYNG